MATVKLTCSVHGTIKPGQFRLYRGSKKANIEIRCKLCDKEYETKRNASRRRTLGKKELESEIAQANNLPNISRDLVESKRIQIKMTKMFSKYTRSK